jgi:membrane protease YdiL (CAAX protease family)
MERSQLIMSTSGVQQSTRRRFQLYRHPWLGLLAFLLTTILSLVVMAIFWFEIVKLPRSSASAGLIQMTTMHLLTLFVLVPYVLRLPNGRTTFRQYLDDIRLSHIRPFLKLLLLALSCYLILALCQAAGSIVYRLSQGLPLTADFLAGVFDLRRDLPPQSQSWLVALPSIFEEVAFRGVVLTLFLRYYSNWKAITISAVAFGAMHLLNLLNNDAEPIWVLGQVVWTSIFGLFYGVLAFRSDSLIPPMIVHYLGNVFVGTLNGYVGSIAALPVQALIGVTFTFGIIPTSLLILWVRFFSDRWLPVQERLKANMSLAYE